MKTDFKVYKRKIHVYRERNILDGENAPAWVYIWSSNAYQTCRDAVKGAEEKHPGVKFKASFAKD